MDKPALGLEPSVGILQFFLTSLAGSGLVDMSEQTLEVMLGARVLWSSLRPMSGYMLELMSG